ncbi:phenazine biosynthesis-like domain-containing protein isoform X2 [Anneissia japonica]|uniref:phenazine biosynthesis-like domain-containing protein isoform X1 n=2 Tax=Anneissia japonica TaxID=1529436 RepID=UPI001425A7F2|nr:phenazine biosynthesis-like domain-containing protein isoform X1 [Anneissia japonica]XP_033114184.1 phenazine biosynthesis-like domain-containing protein isoform X2 [Anneissia japonica]
MAVVSNSRRISLPIFLVDAFASKQFEGNPAAVCLLATEVLGDAQMLKITMEMNQTETAFVSPVNPSDTFQTGEHFNLRWFTPTNEVNLCGHATMATSAVIFGKRDNTNEQLTFHTKSGELMVSKVGDEYVMDFPLNHTAPQDQTPVKNLIQMSIGKIIPQDVQYAPKPHGDLVIRLPDSTSRDVLEGLKPDTTAMMKAFPDGHIKGVIVTLRGCPENGAKDECGEIFDFMSRYFDPWNGFPEDPVTGVLRQMIFICYCAC